MYFTRLRHLRDPDAMAAAQILLIGAGRTASRVGWHLARNGATDITVVDYDVFEAQNMPGHVLPASFITQPKATALAMWLSLEMPWVRTQGVIHRIRGAASYPTLLPLIERASLVVVATDDPAAQNTAGRACVAADTPALYPGLYERGGGEVFLTLGPDLPCYECWSRFRPTDAQLRAVAAASHDSLAVEQATVHLALGLIDRRSPYAAVMFGSRQSRAPRQLYTIENFGGMNEIFADDRTWGRATATRRPNCPGCAASRRLATSIRPGDPPARDLQPARPIGAAPRRAPARRAAANRATPWMTLLLIAAGLAVGATLIFPGAARRMATHVDLGSQATSVGAPATSTATDQPRSRRTPAKTPTATIAVVHLSPGDVGPSSLAAWLVTGEVGRVFVHVQGRGHPVISADRGQLTRRRRFRGGWWEWWYRAPSRPGRVRLTLAGRFPHATDWQVLTPLNFQVRPR